MKKLIFTIGFLLPAVYLNAQDSNLSKSAAAYLDLGVGSKAAAMGNAYVSIAYDPSAIYWNSAILPHIQIHQASLMSSFSSIGRRHNYIGYIFPLGEKFDFRQSIGLGWINYGIGGIQGRDAYGNTTDKFSDAENTFILAYGQETVYNYSVGVAFKCLMQNLADYSSASGIGFDFGILYKNDRNDFSFGLNMQNLISELNWIVDDPVLKTKFKYEEKVLINTKAGISKKLLKDKLIMSFDIDKTETQELRFHFGSNFEIADIFSLSSGYDNSKITGGFGWKRKFWKKSILLNYAFIYEKYGFDTIHRFTIDMIFGRERIAYPFQGF
jgi:hypothetical protein